MVQTVSLLSPAFLGLVALTAILLGTLRGRARQIAFLVLNVAFLALALLGPAGTALAIGFAATGYGLARGGPAARPGAYVAGMVGLVLLFVYVKRYSFVEALLPSTLLPPIVATIGLSFLFFKVLHVAIDARSQTLGPIDAGTYFGYCLSFVTYPMGPIQRFQDYRQQWEDSSDDQPLETFLDAVIRILVGLIKAYVLAEWIKPFVGPLTEDPLDRTTAELLSAIYAFNVYLYLNFAGYCDVAIGAGTLMGLRTPENFDKPFLARNVSEFWQRQHRSLTTWLTDYVFTPAYTAMLRARRPWLSPLAAANLSLIVTMVVSGLWHGTSVAFLLFGLIHGAYLVIFRTWDTYWIRMAGRDAVRRWRARWWVQLAGMFITFNAVSFAFMFFLLDTRTAVRILGRLVWP